MTCIIGVQETKVDLISDGKDVRTFQRGAALPGYFTITIPNELCPSLSVCCQIERASNLRSDHVMDGCGVDPRDDSWGKKASGTGQA